VEVERGVWENQLISKKVKAEQEQIYQRRLDQATLEGLVITARFRIRSELIKGDLKYVSWKDPQKKYKVNSVNHYNESHFTVIEIGELI
jgi:hypothetical protein